MLNRHQSRLFIAILVVFITIGLAFMFLGAADTTADIMFNRSVTISSGQPSAVTTQAFKFDIPTTSVVGSIVFEYCTNSPIIYETCTAPAGMDASGASLASQSGNVGFNIDNAATTANQIVLTRPATPGIITSNNYVFNNITNPSAPGTAIFVRISTHAATDGSGAWEDNGSVAFAIQNSFQVGAYVPPFLQLCVGVTVAPDCSVTSGDSIDLGILSTTRANAGQSQFATATNDPTGYIVYALGTTMTSGNDIISALASPTPSSPGTPQFGINLRANLVPAVGQDPVGLGTAAPTLDYDQPNRFMFNSGDSIASSTINTNYNRMTVSYLVNVPSKQAPGVYATTFTYVATVQF